MQGRGGNYSSCFEFSQTHPDECCACRINIAPLMPYIPGDVTVRPSHMPKNARSVDPHFCSSTAAR
ncbi:hypothetical protein TNCT_257901, partial [Trichonephila clavata]